MVLSLGSWLDALQGSPQLFKLALALLTAVTAVAKGLPALANASRRHQGNHDTLTTPARLRELSPEPASGPWPDTLEQRFAAADARERSHHRSVVTCRSLLLVCVLGAVAVSGGLVAARPRMWEVSVGLVAGLASLAVAWLSAALRRLREDESKPTPGIEHSGEVVLVGALDDVRQLALFNLVHHVGARVVSVRAREIVALSGIALPLRLALGARLAVTLAEAGSDGVRVRILSTKLDYVLPGRGATAVTRFLQSWAAASPMTPRSDATPGRREAIDGRAREPRRRRSVR